MKRIKLLAVDELFLAKLLMISGISILVITALWAVVTPCPNQSHQSQNSQQEAIAAPVKE